MKILVINWRDVKNPLAGGAEIYFQEIFRRIVTRGHEVTQLAVNFPGASKTDLIDGIRIVRMGGANTFNFSVWAGLNRILRAGGYDIVIDDLNKIPFYSPWFCDKPVLAMMMHLFRKSIFSEVAFPLAAYVYLTESLIPRCYKNNLFAVLSPSSKRDLLAFGIREEKMVVIPPGTDTARFVPDLSRKGEPLVLHVGRLKRYKSTDHLLEAAHALKLKGKRFKVKIVGDGDDLPRLKETSRRLALEDIVEFTGFISEDDKVRLYQESAVLVENSLKEGWGLIVMEANACATPVIAARSPGLVDSVHDGKTGFLYEYGNVPELTERLGQLLDDAQLRSTMGAAGVEWAKSISWDSATDKMLVVIERAVTRGQVPGIGE
jgi:glycosyltransferase involved in cell wall biosynthesis